MGYTLKMTYDDEFTLAYPHDDGTYRPIDESLCFSSIAMDVGNPVILDIKAALKAQGIQHEQHYPELGHGQHELSITPTEPLKSQLRRVVESPNRYQMMKSNGSKS
jgi:glutamine synthetase